MERKRRRESLAYALAIEGRLANIEEQPARNRPTEALTQALARLMALAATLRNLLH